MPALLRHPGRAGQSIESRGCRKRAIQVASYHDPARLALVATSAGLRSHLLVSERVSLNGGRLEKRTIVALARKLLVALWKYVTAGVVIEGAVMKTI